MRIAPFRKSSLPPFKAMMKESSGEFGSAWAKHITRVFASGAHWQNAGNYAVLEEGRAVAAFSLRSEVEALVLYFLLISKDFRNKGIGASIIKFAEKEAKKTGAAFLRLDAYSGKKAILFYKKQGFKVGGRVRYYEEVGDDQTFLYKKIR